MDFTIDKIARGLFITLILMFFINQYIEIPEFTILFFLLCVASLFVIWKEILEFKKAKEAISYDFKLKKTKEQSLINTIIEYALFILLIVTPFFVEFPFEKRTNSDDYFYFSIFIFLLGGISYILSPKYDYYYFGKRNISMIGSPEKTILWNDIKAIETKEGLDTFYLSLKDGSKIPFKFNNAYYDWGWDEVMNYFKEKELNVVKWQKPEDSFLTQKYNNWWF
ncbi:MAG: hypothetical protein WDZ45_02605 [Flavobacteriaceae bacterium]